MTVGRRPPKRNWTASSRSWGYARRTRNCCWIWPPNLRRSEVSADLPEYIMERDIVRAALRTAKEVDATDEEWQEFIDRITQRGKRDE